jgi:hypothetical protein
MRKAGILSGLARRLHDVGGRQPRRLELVGNEQAAPVIAEHEEVAKQVAGKAAAGLLEQRLRARQLVELLGEGFARERPEPGA